jgi:hypothetical protein
MRHFKHFACALLLTGTTLFSSEAFTGKILGNHVRMRLQPSLDSVVVDELDKEDLVLVEGDTEDFYAITPPKYIKAYIYRTYVVDGVIEGNHVNCRLDPHLESPIIGQLEQGTKVEGVISPINNKWYEIQIPDSVRFYISKHFVQRAGGPEMLAERQKSRDDVENLLQSSQEIGREELKKPFNEINMEGTYASLNKIINDYKDFPTAVEKAKKTMTDMQDKYLQQKIAFLETQARASQENSKDNGPNAYSSGELEKLLERNQKQGVENVGSIQNGKMTQWIPIEEQLYLSWKEENPEKSRERYQKELLEESLVLRGVIESYDRPVRNKPGDFVLVNKFNNIPIAYLYSTNVNLQDKIGQEVTIRASLRPNHHFAYPAYFVMGLE